jgi:hypothetical protein
VGGNERKRGKPKGRSPWGAGLPAEDKSDGRTPERNDRPALSLFMKGVIVQKIVVWFSSCGAASAVMPFKECHISMMDVEQLRHAWRTITNHNPTPESVRAWAKEKKHAGTD